MTRPRGGYIGFNRVPAAAAASGVWTLREAEEAQRAGTWPTLSRPNSISGLQLWIDFSNSSSVTLESGFISQVNDLSGNGYNATASSGSRPTTSTMNGLTCANWGTAANNFRLAYSSGSDNRNWREVAVVAAWDGTQTTFPNYNGLFTGSAESGTGGGIGLIGYVGNSTWYFPDGESAWTTNILLNNVSTTTAFNTIKSPFVVQFWRSSNVGVNGYCLGQDRQITFAGNRGWIGRICEVVAYNAELSSGDRTLLRNYLALKWGVTL